MAAPSGASCRADRVLRRDQGVEPLAQLRLRGEAGDLLDLLAVLEEDHRRHGHDPVLRGHGARGVDVDLADLDLAGVLLGQLLDDGGEALAGGAPGRRRSRPGRAACSSGPRRRSWRRRSGRDWTWGRGSGAVPAVLGRLEFGRASIGCSRARWRCGRDPAIRSRGRVISEVAQPGLRSTPGDRGQHASPDPPRVPGRDRPRHPHPAQGRPGPRLREGRRLPGPPLPPRCHPR